MAEIFVLMTITCSDKWGLSVLHTIRVRWCYCKRLYNFYHIYTSMYGYIHMCIHKNRLLSFPEHTRLIMHLANPFHRHMIRHICTYSKSIQPSCGLHSYCDERTLISFWEGAHYLSWPAFWTISIFSKIRSLWLVISRLFNHQLYRLSNFPVSQLYHLLNFTHETHRALLWIYTGTVLRER